MIDTLIEQSFSGTAPETALVRLFCAVLLGGVIGFERALHARTAGLRTHILVSLASCLFALLTFEIMARFQGEVSDPLRLIEAVTSGVAFLAAGSIIMSGGRVLGLTTGAGMWLAGAIGVACGIGAIALAVLATLILLPVLWVLRGVSHRIEEENSKGEAPERDDRAQ
ncbi:MgtC/SapB family protein [Pararhodobacter sp. SW119]|uniref:MgtC/SapB family protein n=1 Tax=Pararhodobacter sp. SW119 TaxID=2780075 RepID=UPI001ADFA6B4|nr:MgtC/SapB family protein [Pararhodobacter sp. SW119]